MTATTFNSEKQARQEYALLTIEELQARNLAELRKMASDCGIKSYDRDGKRVPMSSSRKAEVVNLIYQACSDERLLLQVKTELSEEQLKEVQGIGAEADEVFENDLGDLATKAWTELREYSMNLYDAQTQTWRAVDGILLSQAGNLVNILKSRNYAITTTLNYKRIILTKMAEMLSLEASSPYFQGLSEVFKQFEKEVHNALKFMSREKKVVKNRNIARRNVEVCHVNVEKLYDWAVDTLVNLRETDNKTLWGDVTLALMLVTGRRQSEILCSASFEVVSENTVFFKGQLKTKGRNQEAVEGFEIPVLAPSEAVVAGLNWLILKGKRAETPEQAHKRFSRQIIPYIDAKQDLYRVVATPPNLAKAAKGERLTSHLCRQIYGQVASDNFMPGHYTPEAYIAGILGHSDGDMETVKSYTADIRVVYDDME